MKKLEFLVKLYQAKCLLGSTDKGMDIMLKLVKSILPDGETLPNNFYDVKQLIKDLALIFVKVYNRSYVVACKGLMAVDQGLFPIDVQDWRRFEHGTTPGDAWKRIKGRGMPLGYNGLPFSQCFYESEERWNCTDDRVSKEQWRLLVQYWETGPTQKRSIANKCNCAKRRMHHTTGTKSYAQVRNQYKVNHRGVSPDKCKMFELCHLRKNGTPVNETAAKAMVRLNLIVF
ncbi:unnamed protein product [Prunus armeniaca]